MKTETHAHLHKVNICILNLVDSAVLVLTLLVFMTKFKHATIFHETRLTLINIRWQPSNKNFTRKPLYSFHSRLRTGRATRRQVGYCLIQAAVIKYCILLSESITSEWKLSWKDKKNILHHYSFKKKVFMVHLSAVKAGYLSGSIEFNDINVHSGLQQIAHVTYPWKATLILNYILKLLTQIYVSIKWSLFYNPANMLVQRFSGII